MCFLLRGCPPTNRIGNNKKLRGKAKKEGKQEESKVIKLYDKLLTVRTSKCVVQFKSTVELKESKRNKNYKKKKINK